MSLFLEDAGMCVAVFERVVASKALFFAMVGQGGYY